MTFAEAIARLQGNPKLKFESIEELTNRYHVLRVSPSGFFYLDIYESKGGRLIYPDCGAGNFNGSVQIESDWKQIQEPVARVDLKDRQRRHRKRMLANGATKTECKAVTKLEIVERDPKLKLIFEGIVRKYQSKYALDWMPTEERA